MSYVLRPRKQWSIEQIMHLAQPDSNMNILATHHMVGLWLVSPLTSLCVNHNLIATVIIAAVE